MRWRNYIKPIAYTAGTILGLFLFLIFVIALVGHIRPSIDQVDAILVLGSAHPTMASHRALEGLRLYREEKAPLIILSGGYTFSKINSEAAYMAYVIKAATTSTPNILLEEQARSTYENIKNAHLKTPEVKSIIIVTDNFHILRSVLTAKALGFQHVYWSSPEGYLTLKELIYYYPREITALFKYLPVFIFKR